MRVELACQQSQCSLGNWSVSLSVKDQGHSGLAGVQLSVGTGTLTVITEGLTGKSQERSSAPDENVDGYASPLVQDGEGQTTERHLQDRSVNISAGARGRIRYTSNCCDYRAELLVWDTAGNKGHCHLTASQQRALRERSSAAEQRMKTLGNLLLCSVLTLMFSFIST